MVALLAAAMAQANGAVVELTGPPATLHDVAPLGDGWLGVGGITTVAGCGVRLDDAGAAVSGFTWGTPRVFLATSIASTPDGARVAGEASTGAFLMAVDILGEATWYRTYGVSGDAFRHVVPRDGGAGVFVHHVGDATSAIAALDGQGAVDWATSLVGAATAGLAAVPGNAGRVLAFGTSLPGDAWIAQVGPAGIDWQWAMDGGSFDVLTGAAPLPGGDTVVAGHAWSVPPPGVVPFAARLRQDGTFAWHRSWAGMGELHHLELLSDGSVVVAGTMLQAFPNVDWPLLVRLAPDGTEVSQLALSLHGTWHSVAASADGQALVAVGLADSVTRAARFDPSLAPHAHCSQVELVAGAAPFPLVIRPGDVAGAPATLAASAQGTPVLRDEPVETRAVCPTPPDAPHRLEVRRSGTGLELSWSPFPFSDAFHVYSGRIGQFASPTATRCFVVDSTPGFVRGPRSTLLHEAVEEDEWYLVTAANPFAESGMGSSSSGPRDEPPSAWRCGPGP